MSVHSESDDAASMFWPGYVDAITNLAINLLFVIAIMSILVVATSKELLHKALAEKSTSQVIEESSEILVMVQALKMAEKKISDLQFELKQVTSKIPPVKNGTEVSPNMVTKQTANQFDESDSSNVVKAEKVLDKALAKSTVKAVEGGLVVLFDTQSVTLTEADQAEVVQKIGRIGPIASSKWRIQVVFPKGFTVAEKSAFYRVNQVRNLLIQNGAQSSNIETRTVPSEQREANNARVTIQRQP